MTVRVELLYFDGCPNYERYLPRLRRLLQHAAAEVTLLRVESEPEAVASHFLGSPSVRVNGVDVEPGAQERTDYGLKCRLYSTDQGLVGEPADRWVRAAVESSTR